VHYVLTSEADIAAAGISDTSVIADDGQYLKIVFGTRKPEIIYFRPDGYIGLRTQNLDRSMLIEYLTLMYRTHRTTGGQDARSARGRLLIN